MIDNPLPILSPLHFYWVTKLPIPYPNKMGKGLNKGIGYPPTGLVERILLIYK